MPTNEIKGALFSAAHAGGLPALRNIAMGRSQKSGLAKQALRLYENNPKLTLDGALEQALKGGEK